MQIATSCFETLKAISYLKKFCRHFAYKLPTKFDHTDGYVDFPFGDCWLRIKGNVITIRLEAETSDSLAKMEGVVGSHMERFAFRDEVKLSWVRQ